jgi:hypothetical protein
MDNRLPVVSNNRVEKDIVTDAGDTEPIAQVYQARRNNWILREYQPPWIAQCQPRRWPVMCKYSIRPVGARANTSDASRPAPASEKGSRSSGAKDHWKREESLARRYDACWHRSIPVSRYASHVGKLARSGRNAARCARKARWLGDARNGGTLCPPVAFACRALRGQCASPWHRTCGIMDTRNGHSVLKKTAV